MKVVVLERNTYFMVSRVKGECDMVAFDILVKKVKKVIEENGFTVVDPAEVE